ncbi:DUF2793 domain-containing protein [Endozoicomonas sp. SM1973]|uniref:DUF2793 domain-containing protein n=1 Tax=Spartinivicinus marinus TaxID=2994442 RepID=A0A853IK87_9GAMM|nr:DUF2793 domain-containing protein [Spartinivicinus marinus]NYZ69495.1 DUF2793 domain-containing protein [Spartinivicinus marinus]
MAKQEVNIGLNYGWSLGESGWNLQMDENLKAIGALLVISVLSATTTEPPASPTPGDRYLVPVGATGVWQENINKVVRWDGSAWEVYTPHNGWEVTAQDTMQRWHYNSENWDLLGNRLARFESDEAATEGNIPVGGTYVNSKTGVIHVRLA